MTLTGCVYKMILEAIRSAGLDFTGSSYDSSTDSFTVRYKWVDDCVHRVVCERGTIYFPGTGRCVEGEGIETIRILEQFARCLERDLRDYTKPEQKRILEITSRIRQYDSQ
jgi:hypothetical protein